MAHRCWALNEIVRAIAAILVTEGWRRSAVSLARCSKRLEEPALAEVWRSLDSFEPLVKCFPPDIWEAVGNERRLSIKRCPLQAEWTRFQRRYASKIRYLRVYNTNSSLAALCLLQLYSDGIPLLPNLVSLSWFSDEIFFFPFLSSLLSPSLTSICIHVSHSASLMLPPILNKLSTLSPDNRLRKIDIVRQFHPLGVYNSSVEEATSRLLMHCNHRLRVFNINSPISASGLRHIMELPSLEEFRLFVHSEFKVPNPLPTTVFPSLRKLDVECSGVRDLSWLKLLTAIENPVLANITVNCPGLDVEPFIEAFKKTIGHGGLQEFRIKSPSNFKITPKIFACTSSFRNLTCLRLCSECSVVCHTLDLTDDDVDLLTKAMACLEYLSIGGEPCGTPSQITFKSLYTISSRCRQLSQLEIHFNPASFLTKVCTESESWDVALGLSNPPTSSSDLCSIDDICTGNIPLPALPNVSSAMALGLMKVFPRLEEIYFEEYENEDWKKVNSLIGAFRTMRFFAFGKG